MNATNSVQLNDARQKTYDELVKKLKKRFAKVAVIRPTGFGKTWLLTKLIKTGKYKRVLYCYPAAVIKNTVVDKYVNDMTDDERKNADIDMDFLTQSDEQLAKYDEQYDVEEDTAELFIEMNNLRNKLVKVKTSVLESNGIDMMTYHKLARCSKDVIKELGMKYDLIIFDECHRIGAPKTKLNVNALIDAASENPSGTRIIGATATPVRTDLYDVINQLFDDNVLYEYNLHNAFKDGLLKVPYYCYMSHDMEDDLSETVKEESKEITDDLSKRAIRDILKARTIEMAKIFNIETYIRDVCEERASNIGETTSYMKFIVFFRDTNHIRTKLDEVNGWFHKAYPDHNINNLIIHSNNSEYKNNVNKLSGLKRKENTIDLICCVDMMNMGYHVNDLTGVVMYRGTSSDIIYIQQLGRALSSGAAHSAIVFDVVDNLHTKAAFEVDERLYKNFGSYNKKQKALNNFNNMYLDPERQVLVNKVTGEDIKAYKYIPPVKENGAVDKTKDIYEFGTIVNASGQKIECQITSDGIFPKENHVVVGATCNKIDETCIKVTGHMASYKEFINKALSEVISIRCKRALCLSLNNFCRVEANHNEVITNDFMLEMYQMDKKAFRKAFIDIIEKESIKYPYQDIKRLAALAKKNKQIVPMEIFARWLNVSINAITELIVKDEIVNVA